MDRRTFIKTAAVGSVALMAGDLATAAPEPIKDNLIKYDFIEPKYLTQILSIKCKDRLIIDYNSPISPSISELYKNYPHITSEMMMFEEKIYLPMIRISNVLRMRTLGESYAEDKTWVVLNESDIDLFNFTCSSLKYQETGHPLMKYWGACCCAWPLYTHKYWPRGWFLSGRGKVLRKKRSQYCVLKVIRKNEK